MKRALHREQAADARGHVEVAIAEIRKVIDVEPSCGPLLAGCYRCLSALADLREIVDSLPTIEREERQA